jgi:hypothetical protein
MDQAEGVVERSSGSSSKRPHQLTVDEHIEGMRSLSFNDRMKVMRSLGCSPEAQLDELVRLATLQLHGPPLDLYGLITSLERPSTLILTVLEALVDKLGKDYLLTFAHATPPRNHPDRGQITVQDGQPGSLCLNDGWRGHSQPICLKQSHI